ncbi:30S ribosomal protein S7 [Candidatus Peregrinibacteria bacterium RIFOXYB2_FULL_32_7]|nr:MAG: 30S ribosomal protein S7 [Candidatus Peregrinibacteria bacterium RIFOXYB2_FULL_32_7]
MSKKDLQLKQFNYTFGETEEKFINYIMQRGKKSVARKIFTDSLDIIKDKKKNLNPLDLFHTAIENAKPAMEVRPKRVGGSIYQVPREVPPKRQIMLAFRWILEAAKNRGHSAMNQKLAEELIQAADKTGPAIKKKEDTHRMAQANKAFAHFAKY